MTDIANFLARNSPRFSLADIDRDIEEVERLRLQNAMTRNELSQQPYRNTLLQNQAARVPQVNRAQDLDIDAAQFDLSRSRRDNASKIAVGIFTAIADAQDPIGMGATLLQGQTFRDLGAELGLPVDQFRPGPGDDPEQIRAAARSWAQAVGAQSAQQQQRVQGMFPGKNGNQWFLTTDGRPVDTGIPVSQFAQRPIETAAGIEGFDPARGTTTGPISPAAAAPALDQAAEARKFAENLGSGRGQAQADYEAAAPQRLERARQQITNIDNTLVQVDRALKNINWSTVGAIGDLTKAIPGTPAHDMQQTLLTIQANLGFDRIQQMREASPTGGALGQVAVQELNALQAAVAALAQSQSAAQFRANLQTVNRHYQNWRGVIIQSQGGGDPNAIVPNSAPGGGTSYGGAVNWSELR